MVFPAKLAVFFNGRFHTPAGHRYSFIYSMERRVAIPCDRSVL